MYAYRKQSSDLTLNDLMTLNRDTEGSIFRPPPFRHLPADWARF